MSLFASSRTLLVCFIGLFRFAQSVDHSHLKVDGEYVVPLTADGKHFSIDENIHRIYLNIGVLTATDFGPEILNDPHLLVLGIDANPSVLGWQQFKHERFKLFNFAAGSENKYIEFNVNKEPGCSSVLAGNLRGFKAGGLGSNHWVATRCIHTDKKVRVPMTRLEDFIAMIPEHIPVEWVKIDAQGYDFVVLQSMGSQIKRVKKLQFETQNIEKGSSLALYENAPAFSEVTDWVVQRGFPQPVCTSDNDIQTAIKEVDCVTCRDVETVTASNCYRKG